MSICTSRESARTKGNREAVAGASSASSSAEEDGVERAAQELLELGLSVVACVACCRAQSNWSSVDRAI